MKYCGCLVVLLLVPACGSGASPTGASGGHPLTLALYSGPSTYRGTSFDNGFAGRTFGWTSYDANGTIVGQNSGTVLNDNSCLNLTVPPAAQTAVLMIGWGLTGDVNPPNNPSYGPRFFPDSQPYWTVTLPPFDSTRAAGSEQPPPVWAAVAAAPC